MTVAKAIVQLVMTVLAAIVPALAVGPLDPTAWVNIVVLAAGTVMVYNASNDIPGWNYAKLIASAVSAVAVVLTTSLAGGLDATDYIQMALAAAAALGVGAIPNGGPAAHAAP